MEEAIQGFSTIQTINYWYWLLEEVVEVLEVEQEQMSQAHLVEMPILLP